MRNLVIVIAFAGVLGCGKTAPAEKAAEADKPAVAKAETPPPQVSADPVSQPSTPAVPLPEDEPLPEDKPVTDPAPQPEKIGGVVAEKAAPTAPSSWDNDTELVWPMDQQLLAANTASAGDGERMAFGVGGSGNPVATVWKKLGSYQTTYLRTWSDAFSQPPGSATEVVDAFNELAFAVTGPQGFWRNTLPRKWLGCQNDPDSEPCTRLKDALPKLQQWDKVQAKMSKMSAGKATRFLGRNQKRMMTYFDNYVPTEPSGSAMKETGFYKDNLDGLLE